MEKKKYSYEHLFQKIHEKMEDHSNRSEKSNTFNIFKVLGIADKEVLICRLLGDLLDPNGSHGLKEKPLLAFLEQLQVANYFSLDKIKKAYTVLEETVEYDRRVDIVVYIGDVVIPIEVKIWAGDQSQQLYDYYQYYSKTRCQNGTFKIYYLTPNGRSPSEISICDPATNQRLTPDQYQCLSFREDVGDWLERNVFHHQLIVFFLFGDLCFQQMGLKARLFLENGLLLYSLQSAQQHPVDHHHAQQQAGSCQDELPSPH